MDEPLNHGCRSDLRYYDHSVAWEKILAASARRDHFVSLNGVGVGFSHSEKALVSGKAEVTNVFPLEESAPSMRTAHLGRFN